MNNNYAKTIQVISSSVIAPLGEDVSACYQQIVAGNTSLRRYEDAKLSAIPFVAAQMPDSYWVRMQEQYPGYTQFEQMAIDSIKKAIAGAPYDFKKSDTILVLATTKGNIEHLGSMPESELALSLTAKTIGHYFGLTNPPIVISNACASGVAALLTAHRMLSAGKYQHAIVCGCDRMTRFVLSGFQSFLAISDEVCRPFDATRKGINLGEAAATVILSSLPVARPLAVLCGGATTNDANHISGPSRTGQELSLAIGRALAASGVSASDIGMISAHGTGTLFNDEMESKAFNLSGLSYTPIHSLKGYTGHTLGAAGVLESAIAIEFMNKQQLLPSYGFEKSGVPVPLQVTTQVATANYRYLLKTSSGFGGCNGALVWGLV